MRDCHHTCCKLCIKPRNPLFVGNKRNITHFGSSLKRDTVIVLLIVLFPDPILEERGTPGNWRLKASYPGTDGWLGPFLHPKTHRYRSFGTLFWFHAKYAHHSPDSKWQSKIGNRNGALVNGTKDQNPRSNSCWFNFDPQPNKETAKFRVQFCV